MDLSFSALFSSLIISTIGAGFFLYGKKASRPPFLLVGLLMCIYPYFIASQLILWVITIGLLASVYHFRHSF